MVIDLQVGRVHPSVPGWENVVDDGQGIDIEMGCHLTPVVGNIVFDALEHVENPHPSQRQIAIIGNQTVDGLVAPIGSQILLVHPPQRDLGVGGDKGTAVDIVAAVVGPVGVIGQIVVFKAVNPVVVVQVNAKEKFRPVRAIAEEGLLVIGDAVAQGAAVVLVKVRDKIIVLVPPGKNDIVSGPLVKAKPVGDAILVVVVVNQLVQRGTGLIVDHVPRFVNDEGRRIIIGIEAEGLTVKKERGRHL